MVNSPNLLSDLPVTLVTGYLGSGKTTYINQRLANAEGVRYAVMVNDFGELNIDAELIAASTEKTISLTNGCVCCSLADDMDAAMEQVQQLRSELDWVLFEASGVADPERIKTKIEARPGFALQEFLTLIDVTRIKTLVKDKFIGQHIRRQLQLLRPSTTESANSQIIEYGARLTKTDLVSEAVLSGTQTWLAEFQVDDKYNRDTSCGNSGLPQFYTRIVESTTPLNRGALEHWLSTLGSEIVRMKGFVYLIDEGKAGDPTRYLLQWVSGVWRLELADKIDAAPVEQIAHSRLVLISYSPIDVDFEPRINPS